MSTLRSAFHSSNIKATQQHLAGLYQRPVSLQIQKTNGLNAQVRSFKVGFTQLTSIAYGESVELQADYRNSSNPAKGTLIMLCIKGSGAIEIDQEPFDLKTHFALIARPQSTLRALLTNDCERWLIRVPARPGLLTKHLTSNLHINLQNHLSLSAYYEQIQALMGSKGLLHLVQKNQEISNLMEQLITRLFQQFVDTLDIAIENSDSDVVLQAEHYLRTFADQDVSIEKLCDFLNISPRSLQNYFKEKRNYSPSEFLQGVRLENARAALVNNELNKTVTEIAHECGFNHLGRFSQNYRQRYGELPSDTLKKYRRL